MSAGRQYLTEREYDTMLAAQGGTCIVPGCEETKGLEEEHTIPNALKAGKPDALMCKRHHRMKTKKDRKVIAKVYRLSGRTTTQADRRAKRKAEGRRPLLPTKPMGEGRGFSTTLTKGLDGKVRSRKQKSKPSAQQ